MSIDVTLCTLAALKSQLKIESSHKQIASTIYYLDLFSLLYSSAPPNALGWLGYLKAFASTTSSRAHFYFWPCETRPSTDLSFCLC